MLRGRETLVQATTLPICWGDMDALAYENATFAPLASWMASPGCRRIAGLTDRCAAKANHGPVPLVSSAERWTYRWSIAPVLFVDIIGQFHGVHRQPSLNLVDGPDDRAHHLVHDVGVCRE